MKKTSLIIASLMAAVVIGAQAFAATQAEIKAAAKNPLQLKALLAGKTSSEAAALVGQVIAEALASGGNAEKIKSDIANIAAAAIASVPADSQAAMAAAIVVAAGANHTQTAVAAIALAIGTADNAKSVVDAAVNAADANMRTAARNAANDPVGTLGETLAAAVVVTVNASNGVGIAGSGGKTPSSSKLYEAQ